MQILCEDDEFDDVSECIYIILLLTSVFDQGGEFPTLIDAPVFRSLFTRLLQFTDFGQLGSAEA